MHANRVIPCVRYQVLPDLNRNTWEYATYMGVSYIDWSRRWQTWDWMRSRLVVVRHDGQQSAWIWISALQLNLVRGFVHPRLYIGSGAGREPCQRRHRDGEGSRLGHSSMARRAAVRCLELETLEVSLLDNRGISDGDTNRRRLRITIVVQHDSSFFCGYNMTHPFFAGTTWLIRRQLIALGIDRTDV
jgi:hypothetical protein